MVRSTKQETATVPAARPDALGPRPSKSAKNGTSGAIRTNGAIRTVSQHDGAPGLGHPIFDQLIAELGDPSRTA